MVRGTKVFVLLLWLWPAVAGAQNSPDITKILERLDRLEQENRSLAREVEDLKTQLAATQGTATAATLPVTPPVTVEQRLDIQEQRIEEQAQTKVEASEKFPLRLTGMLLFNSFMDSKQNGGSDYPTVAAPGVMRAGATLRQSTIGLEFHGPRTVWGGTVRGAVFMDFFTGANFNPAMRLRVGSIEVDWKSRKIVAGLEKPIFNPRDPSSLAQVGISPLTGAGNLWLWIPQVQFQQDLAFGSSAGLQATVGAVQTREVGPYGTTGFTGTLAPSRPGLEGRFNLFYKLDDTRRLEFASGFHTSTTHVNGLSVPSNLYSLDWFFNPWQKVEFSGVFYSGQNVTNLGTGAINQGYELYGGHAEAIRGKGGWGQLTLHALRRVDLHLFTGQQDDNNSQLGAGDIGKNVAYGVNLFYRLAPNVILAPEISQLRTFYLGRGVRINNHYDLALAYLF